MDIVNFLRDEQQKAIDYCNKYDFAHGGEGLATDEELIESNLVSDILMLSILAVCADGTISKNEFGKLSKYFADIIPEFNPSDMELILEAVKEVPPDTPKTLIAVALKAKLRIRCAKEDDKATVTEEELAILNSVISAYAYLMCSAPERIGAKEKETILNYLNGYCEYIADELEIAFPLSSKIAEMITNA